MDWDEILEEAKTVQEPSMLGKGLKDLWLEIYDETGIWLGDGYPP